ncbi:molybdenum cofactor biosynthesis protein A [Rhinocladiella mackenziei CBS 650.93]|uniref:Molybdenum cofactor biosynthesis protein A n=1 Tax=Rhinocladiella mackenziei CBS 650.93 TaxID=1442369 RepID=A0A0D2IN76_9EURO|nr:molybdenum cofactor biosynthesis protein A [Rhinocladiella mackenziei CBS 650.93]KIX07279.1 molybdenum cofactor biosynthesis protein A [Rhinocladiella mackenziei CBS 650.93]
MAEASFKQMIATSLRQTRPQSFRHSKPSRYLQCQLSTTVSAQPQAPKSQTPRWQAHTVQPAGQPQTKLSRLDKLRNETEPRPFSSFLTDNYSRHHNYLRISVTERCNLRCLYCMPEEGVQLSPSSHLLTTAEIVYLSELFVNQGVNKIRLTGGEPTVRKDFVDLMRQIGRLRSHGLKELCITTNGISLHRKLDSMVESGLTGVNLSLDTLDPHLFTVMTRRNGHEAVMKSINRILEINRSGAGIKLKINCVVMRGLNEREILPFVELGRDQDLEVRFIEYMPFDGNKWSEEKMMSFGEMLALIRQKYPDVHKVQDHKNDTSKTYQVPSFAGRIGFITSMTHNFCGTCNRLRITGDGNLKVCLFGNAEVSLRDILRESNDGKPIDAEAMEAMRQLEMDRRQHLAGSADALGVSEKEAKLLDVIGMAVKRKKEKHAGIGELENMKNRPMILIGGTIRGQEVYRPIHSRDPENIPAHSTSTWLQTRQRALERTAPRDLSKSANYARFLTRDIARRRSFRPRGGFFDLGPEIPNTWNKKKPPTGDQETQSDDSPSTSTDESQQLTHLTSTGEAHMVSIAGKKPTIRSATAESLLLFSNSFTYGTLVAARLRKGDALSVARIAGIQAAKKTSDIIPLAHPGLNITGMSVRLEPFLGRRVPGSHGSSTVVKRKDIHPRFGGVLITATVACEGKTGVEMEAITAASVAGLTMYDMLKGVDKAMVLTATRVIAKSGGKSGDWIWDPQTNKIVPDTERAAELEKERSIEKQDQDIKAREIQERIMARRDGIDGIGHENADDEDADAKSGQNNELSSQSWTETKTPPVAVEHFQRTRERRFRRIMRARRIQHDDTGPASKLT